LRREGWFSIIHRRASSRVWMVRLDASPGRPQKCGNNFRISDIAEQTGVTLLARARGNGAQTHLFQMEHLRPVPLLARVDGAGKVSTY